MKKAIIVVSAFLALLFLGGCGEDTAADEGKDASVNHVENDSIADSDTEVEIELEKPREPVELTIVPRWLSMTDEEFDNLLFEPLKQVHPHITVKVNRTEPAQLGVTGEIPDIFYVANVRYFEFADMDIPYDMSEFIKRSQMDMEAFSSPNIDWVLELSSEGEIYGLPFDLNHYALFYNKDIFDQRGVDYPVDGMTFAEVLDLSRELTYNDGGVQYRGFIPLSPHVLSGTRSLPYYDPINKKSLLDTAEHKAILELIKPFYEIPGIIENNQYPIQGADFILDQTVAMSANWITDTVNRMSDNNIQMNFDIVGVPSFEDLPGVTIHSGAKLMGISKTSKHLEDAFLAIEYWTSPEVQSNINRGGRLTVLADENIRKDFGADIELLRGKNIQGALQVKPAMMIPPHEYNAMIGNALDAVRADLALGTKDINTLLREAQEAADQAIAAAEQAKNN